MAESVPAVLGHQPSHCRLLAESRRATLVTDPVLVGHRLPQGIGLAAEFSERGPLLGELVEAILDRLVVAAVWAVGIHCAEGHALDIDADKLSDNQLRGRSVTIPPTQIDRHLQGSLPGRFITRLLVG